MAASRTISTAKYSRGFANIVKGAASLDDDFSDDDDDAASAFVDELLLQEEEEGKRDGVGLEGEERVAEPWLRIVLGQLVWQAGKLEAKVLGHTEDLVVPCAQPGAVARGLVWQRLPG